MDDLVPEKLWEEKGADYIAPYDEVLEPGSAMVGG